MNIDLTAVELYLLRREVSSSIRRCQEISRLISSLREEHDSIQKTLAPKKARIQALDRELFLSSKGITVLKPSSAVQASRPKPVKKPSKCSPSRSTILSLLSQGKFDEAFALMEKEA